MLRRVLSLVLLAVFSLPLMAQAAACFAQNSESRLPACCRRHGVHACSMLTPEGQHAPAVGSRCTMYPRHAAVTPMESGWALAAPQTHTALPSSALLVTRSAETNRRIARDRSRYKRGPPSISL